MAIKMMSDPIVSISILLMFIINICIFIFCVMDSSLEENKYGPSPKYIIDYGDKPEIKQQME